MRTQPQRCGVTGAGPRARPAPGRAAPAALLSLAWLILFASAASAQSRFRPRFSLDAFGTLGVIYSTETRADFIETTTRTQGPGFSNRLDASLDSRLAVQASAYIGPKLTAVVQMMAEQTVDGDYVPHAEWANVSYAFTPDIRVRGGRIVMPAFLVSDARKVSYANPWLRPPVEVYGMVPIYSLDGVDATYRRRLGEWIASLNAVFGRTQSDFPGGAVQAERVWNVNTTFVRGALTGRLAMMGSTVRIDMLTPLFDGFRAFGPEGQAIANRFEVHDRALRFATAGLEFDPGTWFTMAEVGWIDSNSAIGERLAGYVTSGVRWGAFTPYLTWSRATLLSESSTAGLDLTGLPPESAQAAAELNAGLNAFLNNAPVQQNLAIGGRWDFRPGIALKAQLDFVDVLGSSAGTFTNLQPGFEPGGRAGLFSLATTFVF
jgi:hypothetical protein